MTMMRLRPREGGLSHDTHRLLMWYFGPAISRRMALLVAKAWARELRGWVGCSTARSFARRSLWYISQMVVPNVVLRFW
jgi:hypothetical protein